MQDNDNMQDKEKWIKPELLILMKAKLSEKVLVGCVDPNTGEPTNEGGSW